MTDLVERRWIGVVPNEPGARVTQLKSVSKVMREQGLIVTEWVPLAALEAAQAQAAGVRRETVARIIMENRDDGACHVKNWAGEELDNPHVAQALRQADAVLAAIRALTDAAKGDRT